MIEDSTFSQDRRPAHTAPQAPHRPGQIQDIEQTGQGTAQMKTGDRIHHRPPQERSPVESLPAERARGRQPASRAVCHGLQPALIDEDDHRQEGHWLFCAVADYWLGSICPELGACSLL